MNDEPMKDHGGNLLPPHLEAEIRALEAMSDEAIDFSDIPPTTDWSGAVRGKFAAPGPSVGCPDPDRDVLEKAVRNGWSLASSPKWTPENIARGQCNVTALVLQDVLACQILKTMTAEGWHFYNRMDGERLDMTAGQFTTPPHYDDIKATRKEALAGTTEAAYQALHRAVIEQIGTFAARAAAYAEQSARPARVGDSGETKEATEALGDQPER